MQNLWNSYGSLLGARVNLCSQARTTLAYGRLSKESDLQIRRCALNHAIDEQTAEVSGYFHFSCCPR